MSSTTDYCPFKTLCEAIPGSESIDRAVIRLSKTKRKDGRRKFALDASESCFDWFDARVEQVLFEFACWAKEEDRRPGEMAELESKVGDDLVNVYITKITPDVFLIDVLIERAVPPATEPERPADDATSEKSDDPE